MRKPLFLFVSALALSSSSFSLQLQGSSTEPILSFDQVIYDATGDGTLWARGRTYKASFGVSGAAYIPFLGSDAPRNFPLGLRLESASIGEREIALDPSPTVRRNGDRITIDHGPVLEVYDLAPDSMEQSFHLAARQAAGELTLRMGVNSELQGAPVGRRWEFDGPSGGVSYGEAFAFDEVGNSADVESRFDGSTLELRVPDALSAEGTLVVDPVLSTIGSFGTLGRARRADVAYNQDEPGGQAYTVFEYDFSSSDTDVFGLDLDDDGQTSNLHAVDLTSEIWLDPKVACMNASNSFMVVSEVHLAPGANGLIQGRVRQGTGTNLGGAITMNANPGLFDCIKPDIGAESKSVAGGRYTVVWESKEPADSDIHGRQYFITGSPASDVFSLSSSNSSNDQNPAISDSAGETLAGSPVFNVVWERELSDGSHDIYGAQITPNGFLASSRFPIDTSTRDTTEPSVTATSPFQTIGGRRHYAVSYVAENTIGSDIWAAVIEDNNVKRRRDISIMESNSLFSQRRDPEIVCTGDDYVLAYASTNGESGSIFDVQMATFGLVDTLTGVDVALAERAQVIVDSSNLERRPALISHWDGGDYDSNEAFLVYDTHPSIGAAFSQVGAALVRGWNSPKPIGVQYCISEYNGAGKRGWLGAYGSQDPNGAHVLIANDLPINAFGYLIVSLDRGSVPNAGGSQGTLCLSGAIGRYSNLPNQASIGGQLFTFIDPLSIPQPGGAVSSTFGQEWHFQCWHRDSFAGQPTSNFTNAVSITFL